MGDLTTCRGGLCYRRQRILAWLGRIGPTGRNGERETTKNVAARLQPPFGHLTPRSIGRDQVPPATPLPSPFPVSIGLNLLPPTVEGQESELRAAVQSPLAYTLSGFTVF